MNPSSSSNYYLTYEDVYTKAGLMHQRANIQSLIEEAYAHRRIPILPKMILSGHHNYGIELSSDLSRYLCWEKTRIFNRILHREEAFHYYLQSDFESTGNMSSACRVSANRSISSAAIQSEQIVVKVVDASLSHSSHGRWSRMSNDSKQDVDHNVQIPFSDNVRELAANIRREFGVETDYAAVHIRRGDKLEETAEQTKPQLIAEYLEKIVGRAMPVYVLTDDISAQYTREINKIYPIFHYRMFRNLRALICQTPVTWSLRKAGLLQPDNFLLYAVEMWLLAEATIPIYTFKTVFSQHHLCDVEGWV